MGTKLNPQMTNQLVEIVTDAVLQVKKNQEPIDLHMIEIMHMKHKMATDSRLVNGIVMDHGGRHPDMPKKLENCYILTCNVSLEYEKTEVNSSFFWKNAEEREKLVQSERQYTDEKCQKIIQLKRKVCEKNEGFVLLNQKGIDPICLEMLSNEGILGLRRVKRRNMERLTLAFGGRALNSVEDLRKEDLGFAKRVEEIELGDDKYTTVEGVREEDLKEKNLGKSCTILIKGPNEHTINQIKDAINDGTRAVKNAIDDQCIIPGAGAFEIAAHVVLKDFAKEVSGKARLGVDAFAEALLAVPSVLAENAGLDVQEVVQKVIEKIEKSKEDKAWGINLETGEPMQSAIQGIYDNYIVKKNFLSIAPTLSEQILLIDEIIKAGRDMGPKKN